MAFAICHVFIWAIVFAVAVHCSRCSSGRSRCAAATTPKDAEGIAAQDARENTALAALE